MWGHVLSPDILAKELLTLLPENLTEGSAEATIDKAALCGTIEAVSERWLKPVADQLANAVALPADYRFLIVACEAYRKYSLVVSYRYDPPTDREIYRFDLGGNGMGKGMV